MVEAWLQNNSEKQGYFTRKLLKPPSNVFELYSSKQNYEVLFQKFLIKTVAN